MESAYQTSKLEKLINRTIAGLFALSAVCFMIYTTELRYAHAEGEEDLGSASSSLDASVTVGTACNFSGNVDIPHTSTVMNGVNSTDIGKTTMNVTCNDQGGYAVYAIGYTNDEYGNTALQSNISDDYNISTGTSTSGNTSNWSMKLATVPGTTTATIENGYNNYNVVPDDYTKVATLNTITNPGTSTTGSSISTTYQTYISPTQPAGAYTGKVKYTLVHPSTAPAPEKPIFMQDTATIKSKLANVGDEMQVIDSRDGKKYWITKLADGNIWMTQNLDLELDANKTYTPADTDLPSGVNWAPIRSTAANTAWDFYNGYNEPYSYDPGNLYWNGVVLSNQTICEEYGGTWIYTETCNGANVTTASLTSDDHYHIGNYYNWTAAIAMNNSSSYNTDQQDVNQSICPAGWMLPKSGTTLTGSGSFQYLVNQAELSAGANGNIQNIPTYFVYGGGINESGMPIGGNIGSAGIYWSSIVKKNEYSSNSTYSYSFGFGTAYGGHVSPQQTLNRSYGYSVRCIMREV